MAKKIVSLLLAFLFIYLSACQSFSAGLPRSSHGFPQNAGIPASRLNEFETPTDKEGDPVGQWIVIGIVGALAVGSAVMVPLYVNDKL